MPRIPKSAQTSPTGTRHYKYRVISRPAGDKHAQEEALNKFAGFGYRLKASRVEGGAVLLTFERKTRRTVPAATPATP